jgi:hypothetical protein
VNDGVNAAVTATVDCPVRRVQKVKQLAEIGVTEDRFSLSRE